MTITAFGRSHPATEHSVLSPMKRIALLVKLTAGFAGATLAANTSTFAAEDTQLLTISGNLIDVPDSLDKEAAPASVIEQYYGELNSADRKQAMALQQELARLIPNYEIAFAAADTAEMNSVLSNIAYRWAVLRTFHAEHFTDAARADLFKAYNELYLLLN